MPTLPMMADHSVGSEIPVLARTQMYGVHRHFILRVDMANSARGRDCPENWTLENGRLVYVISKAYLCENTSLVD